MSYAARFQYQGGRAMAYVTVEVDIDIEEHLGELDDAVLLGEIEKRRGRAPPDTMALLRRAFEKMRGTALPEEMRDYFWYVLGRCV